MDAGEFEAKVDPEILPALRRRVGIDLRDIPAARSRFEQGKRQTNVRKSPHVFTRDALVPAGDGVPPVRIRLYGPVNREAALPCLLWVHGGGHVLSSIDVDDQLSEHLVEETGCLVVSVEWRKSPEHPFPAEINDCYTVLTWIASEADRLGIDCNRIAVGGASSGAGSAAGLTLLARDRGEVEICFQLLCYPMLDHRNITPSSHLVTHPNIWNRPTNLLAWSAYLGASSDGEVSAYASPSIAENVRGLPPAFIGVGELDLFRDENIAYALRLLEADVTTELHVYRGVVHGFEGMAPASSVAKRFDRDRTGALQRAFCSSHV